MSESENSFPGSQQYWDGRYRAGGTSGAGSYGRLADFKAEVLNAFVADNQISSVIEFGCGDGNQLSLARYPKYIGLDVAPSAIRLCNTRFSGDRTKSFFLYNTECFVDNHRLFVADLALSLDVIFHLIEDAVFSAYMTHLFNASKDAVVIYASDRDQATPDQHVRHRKFTSWIASNAPTWKLSAKIENRYRFDPAHPNETSFADFHVFRRP